MRAHRPLLALIAVTVLLMFTPGARLLIVLFPLGCFYLGVQALRKRNGLFVPLVLWTLFLTPFLRRVVEYEGKISGTSILAVPFVLLICPFVLVLSRWTSVFNRRTAPFVYAVVAILYGTFIGLVHFAFSGISGALPFWLLPVFFGCYLLIGNEKFSSLYGGFESAMIGGTIFAGLYGVVQWYLVPPWDAAWMEKAEMNSIGKPEMMSLRVFSTLNSPQIAGAFLLVGILFAWRSKSPWKYPAIIAGMASLLLASARSSWIGFLAALAFLAIKSTLKERLRTLAVAVGCFMLILFALHYPDTGEGLSVRFSSLTDVKNDESAQDRSEIYQRVGKSFLASPFGIGLGVDDGMADAEHDSSIVGTVLSLGGPGALIFFGDLLCIAFVLLPPKSGKKQPELLSLQTCLVALLIEIPVNNVIAGQVAVLTWGVIGLAYASLAEGKKKAAQTYAARFAAEYAPSEIAFPAYASVDAASVRAGTQKPSRPYASNAGLMESDILSSLR